MMLSTFLDGGRRGPFQPGDKVTVGMAHGEVVFASEATEPDSDLTR